MNVGAQIAWNERGLLPELVAQFVRVDATTREEIDD
jgi:hypothetical protein